MAVALYQAPDEVAATLDLRPVEDVASLPGTSRRAPDQPFLASADGFSLHAGVAAGADERKKIERLSLTSQGQVRYMLKTPYRDGTTHVVFEPKAIARDVRVEEIQPVVNDLLAANPLMRRGARHVRGTGGLTR